MIACVHVPSPQPQRHLDRFSCFAELAIVTDRLSDRQANVKQTC